MKPLLAFILCLPFIIWMWRRDKAARPVFSSALWIPFIWLMTLGSRPVSWWLGISSSGNSLDGNPFDRTLYLAQIFLALYILSKRQVRWGHLIRQNRGLLIFYLFILATVLWSEYPFVTFKRWFKDLAAIFVIMLLLSEEDPLEAVKSVYARCSYILFPLSVIFIKYFPNIGRQFAHHSGLPMFTGVTQQKNSLGEICLIFGLLLLSELARPNRPSRARFFSAHHLTLLISLGICAWLLFTCNSKTSQICMAIGGLIVLGHKIPGLRSHPRRVVTLVCVGVATYFIADTLFNVSDTLLRLAGRDSTLTERTDIWQAVSENPVNPLVGAGYMMYWDLHRVIRVGRFEVDDLKTAHNGYLETYLDGGILGLIFLAAMLIVMGFRAIRAYLTGSEYGRLVFGFYAVILVYNISESIYARRSPLWFTFLLFSLNFRGCFPPRVQTKPRASRPLMEAAR